MAVSLRIDLRAASPAVLTIPSGATTDFRGPINRSGGAGAASGDSSPWQGISREQMQRIIQAQMFASHAANSHLPARYGARSWFDFAEQAAVSVFEGVGAVAPGIGSAAAGTLGAINATPGGVVTTPGAFSSVPGAVTVTPGAVGYTPGADMSWYGRYWHGEGWY